MFRSKVVKGSLLCICTWLLIQGLKLYIPNPIALHSAVGGVFFISGLLLYRLFFEEIQNFLLPLKIIFKKPIKRVGYRIFLLFCIVSIGAFVLFNPESWHYELEAKINQGFSSLSSAFAVTLVPIYEEFFFRGAAFGAFQVILQQKELKKSSEWAMYFSALLFWIFHAPATKTLWAEALAKNSIPFATGPFFLGLVCAFITFKDESLIFAILLHAAANLLGPLWYSALPPLVRQFFFSSG